MYKDDLAIVQRVNLDSKSAYLKLVPRISLKKQAH